MDDFVLTSETNVLRLGHEPGMLVASQCASCRQRYRTGPRCNAFPEKIPWALMTGDVDHTQPYPGDGGIRWTPRPPTEPEEVLTVVFVSRISAANGGTFGALWMTTVNDAIGFEPVPSWWLSGEVADWRAWVWRSGLSIDKTAAELFDRAQEYGFNSSRWACSLPETVASLTELRERLALLSGPRA